MIRWTFLSLFSFQLSWKVDVEMKFPIVGWIKVSKFSNSLDREKEEFLQLISEL